MAFVIIHHVHRVPTLLPEILQRVTSMSVELAHGGMKIEPNHVYVLPSGQELSTVDGLFSSCKRSKTQGYSNVFTVFLESLSRSRHPGIAVVLSGVDADGSAALADFRRNGGITIVQPPESSASPQMPQAAINTACVDHVLEPVAIADLLERFSREHSNGDGEARASAGKK